MLGRVADESQGGPGALGHGEERVEVAVADGAGLVDDQDGAGVERVATRVVVGQVPGEGLGGDASSVARWRAASPLTAAPTTRHPAASRRRPAARMA